MIWQLVQTLVIFMIIPPKSLIFQLFRLFSPSFVGRLYHLVKIAYCFNFPVVGITCCNSVFQRVALTISMIQSVTGFESNHDLVSLFSSPQVVVKFTDNDVFHFLLPLFSKSIKKRAKASRKVNCSWPCL